MEAILPHNGYPKVGAEGKYFRLGGNMDFNRTSSFFGKFGIDVSGGGWLFYRILFEY